MESNPDPRVEPPLFVLCSSSSVPRSRGVVDSPSLLSYTASVVRGILGPEPLVAGSRALSTAQIKSSGVIVGSIVGLDFSHFWVLSPRTIVRGAP